jgi:hypothetical protein
VLASRAGHGWRGEVSKGERVMEWYDGNCKGEYSKALDEEFDLMLDWCQGVATLEFDAGDEIVNIKRTIEAGATREESKRDLGAWAHEVYNKYTDPLYGAAPDLLAVTQEAKAVLANMMLALTYIAGVSPETAKIVDGFYEIMDDHGHSGIGKRLETVIAKATGESDHDNGN